MIYQIFKRTFSTSVRVEVKNVLDYAKPNQLFKAKETFTLSQLAFFFWSNLLKTWKGTKHAEVTVWSYLLKHITEVCNTEPDTVTHCKNVPVVQVHEG